MHPRWWLALSVVLYIPACFLPALRGTGSGGFGSGDGTMLGWECLVWGIYAVFMVVPTVTWCANPWLWFLWIRLLIGAKRDTHGGYGAVVYATLTLALCCVCFQLLPLPGAFLWLGSIATAAYGTMLPRNAAIRSEGEAAEEIQKWEVRS